MVGGTGACVNAGGGGFPDSWAGTYCGMGWKFGATEPVYEYRTGKWISSSGVDGCKRIFH